jgi:hypothetical protein
MNKMYTFHLDAGHGWIEVPFSEIKQLGLEDKITHYSFIKDATVYLEEDVDAQVFITALKEKYGEELKLSFNEHYQEESFIRTLLPYE